MNAILRITEANGKTWAINLESGKNYLIGRAKENDIVLNDRRVSRKHAHVGSNGAVFSIIDGYYVDGEIKRSVNKVYVNDVEVLDKELISGDEITIGTSTLKFESVDAVMETPAQAPVPSIPPPESGSSTIHSGITEVPKDLSYDDKPLGNTQFVISANEIIEKSAKPSASTDFVPMDQLVDST